VGVIKTAQLEELSILSNSVLVSLKMVVINVNNLVKYINDV
jgi:hypothetical protein